jgi:hypothetical protein
MNKFNSSKGFKRHVFTGSLVLFFLGTLAMTTNVFAFCPDLRQYSCTAVKTCGGVFTDSWEIPCTSLCIIDDNYAYLDAVTYFHCNLGFVNSKKLVGSGASIIEGGCSVNLKGMSMTVDMVDTSENSIVHLNCTPCDGCCIP